MTDRAGEDRSRRILAAAMADIHGLANGPARVERTGDRMFGATLEVLNAMHSLHDQLSRRLGGLYWNDVRQAHDGRSLAALMYLRGTVHHQGADVQ